MIGTRTPFRMSFIGGGSDLKEFYSKSPGCVISTTINKYMYILIHPFFDDRIQVKYSKTELVDRIDEIKHPIVRVALKSFNLSGVDINSIADVPAGTGLGSSSSFTVGLLHALYMYTNQQVSPELLAREACKIEIDILKEPIGKQDQYAAAFGGLNSITFYPDGSVNVEPVLMDSDKYTILEENLLMFYTGKVRRAKDILIDQRKKISKDKKKYNDLKRMTDLARDLKHSLINGDIDDMGLILDENWQLKKSLSNKISKIEIDHLYDIARANGALGGKLLGAGGGGFLLFYCKKEDQDKLRNALKSLKELPFKFEPIGSLLLGIR